MGNETSDQLPASLRARVLDVASRERAPRRQDVRRRALLLTAVGLAVPVALFAALGGAEPGPRPMPLVLATGLGIACLSLVAIGLALGRAGRTLGPTRARLLAVALLMPGLLTLWKLGCSAAYPSMMSVWVTRPGARCFGISLLFGLAPLLAFSFARRGSDPVHPRSLGAAFGAAGGLWAATLVDFWCPVGYPLHVLLGHVLPMLLLAGLGAVAGARLLAPSSSPQNR